MIKSILKIYSLFLLALLLNSCAVSDIGGLFPTDAEENEEVVIREIPGESFDPEDMEEIELAGNNEVGNVEDEIAIIEENSADTTTILDEEMTSGSSEGYASDVAPVQTYVGDRVAEMREEFSSLDNEIKDNNSSFNLLKANGIASAEVYHSTVAAIAARLQIGTTPGNPILLNQYERALTELAEVGTQGQEMVELGNQISLLSARISYLKDQKPTLIGQTLHQFLTSSNPH